MDPKWWIGIGLVAAALVGAGVYEHYKAPSGIVTLSLSANTPYNWSPPGGGTFTTQTYNTSATSTAFTGNLTSATGTAASNGASVTVTPAAVGTAQAIFTWTDASGNTQTTTINFNIVP